MLKFYSSLNTSVLFRVQISHLTTFASSGTGLYISGLCGDFSVCHELCCIRQQGTWAGIITVVKASSWTRLFIFISINPISFPSSSFTSSLHFADKKLTQRQASLALHETSHLIEVREKPDIFLFIFHEWTAGLSGEYFLKCQTRCCKMSSTQC